MSTPKISIVMPVWNGEKYLAEAVDSLLAQSFGDFELIVLDDGSTDSTPAILAACQDRRLRIFRLTHSGYVSALNFGVAQAGADWIARQDADDSSHPLRLEKQWAAVVRCGAAILCHANTEFFGETASQSRPEYFARSQALLALRLCYQNPIVHSTVLFKKSAFEAVGGYLPSETPSEDFSLWGKLLQRGLVVGIPDRLVRFRKHRASVSMTSAQLQHQHQVAIALRHSQQILRLNQAEAGRAFGTLASPPPQRTWNDWGWLVTHCVPRLPWKSAELYAWLSSQTLRKLGGIS